VGFCFSFALEQQALNSGKLLVWTKGFNVEGVIGRDVVQLLSGGWARRTAVCGRAPWRR
jgi:hexokinase